MAHLVPLDFWIEARTAMRDIKPLFWLGECEVSAYHDVFDVTYAWEWMHKSEDLIRGTASLQEIYNVLISTQKYPPGLKIILYFKP